MSIKAAVRLACSVLPFKLGVMIKTRVAKIKITTINSINEKPLSVFRVFFNMSKVPSLLCNHFSIKHKLVFGKTPKFLVQNNVFKPSYS